MNIPQDVAKLQGHHGIKGKSHGAKGGRPKLALSPTEREERRRNQKRASRNRRKITQDVITPAAAKSPPRPAPQRKAWEIGNFMGLHEDPIYTVQQERNEPCQCGSGRKFKKCCGR